MARKVEAVIGANYGDEGKGRCVDYLVSRAQEEPLIVRHNSGAQAGHTVVHDGKRHVFSHFGSGTLRGCATLLGPNFVVNPLAFNLEWEELAKKGVKPRVYVDQRCRVTTPFDVHLNHMSEKARDFAGVGRHGSCGQGFGETIERYERLGERARTVIDEARSWPKNQDALLGYFTDTSQKRWGTDPYETLPDGRRFPVAELLQGYEQHLNKFLSRIESMVRTEEFIKLDHLKHLIFEGAQGVALHQDSEDFPHVTRCRTGLQDVINLLGMARYPDAPVESFYCTRTYLTRHGAGPLRDELDAVDIGAKRYRIEDATNVTNDYQGSLRFATLEDRNLTFYYARVANDAVMAWGEDPGRGITVNVCVSCLDQAPKNYDVSLLYRSYAAAHGQVLLGHGPASSDVEVFSLGYATYAA